MRRNFLKAMLAAPALLLVGKDSTKADITFSEGRTATLIQGEPIRLKPIDSLTDSEEEIAKSLFISIESYMDKDVLNDKNFRFAGFYFDPTVRRCFRTGYFWWWEDKEGNTQKAQAWDVVGVHPPRIVMRVCEMMKEKYGVEVG